MILNFHGDSGANCLVEDFFLLFSHLQDIPGTYMSGANLPIIVLFVQLIQDVWLFIMNSGSLWERVAGGLAHDVVHRRRDRQLWYTHAEFDNFKIYMRIF